MRTAKVLNQQIKNLWNTHDLCRVLQVSPMTVQNWRKRKDLPAVVFPGKSRATIRFIPEEIEAWAKRSNLPFKRPVQRMRLAAGAA